MADTVTGDDADRRAGETVRAMCERFDKPMTSRPDLREVFQDDGGADLIPFIASAIREAVAAAKPAPTWTREPPTVPGWFVYRDYRACWLCYCENDGRELTWRGEIPPGAWDGEWCGPLEVPQ